MLIRTLINQLEELYQKGVPHIPIFGEPTIEIDVFEPIPGEPGKYRYGGIQNYYDIVIQPSSDGVYNVITGFSEAYPSKEAHWAKEKEKRLANTS